MTVPAAARERSISSWSKYLDSVVRQAASRSTSGLCDIEEYMVARRDNIGCLPLFAVMEASLEIDLSHEVMQHPALLSLNQDATDMTILANVRPNHFVVCDQDIETSIGHVLLQEGGAP